MTKEEKQLISIEIDKYFRIRKIDAGWFSSHLKPEIERPNDGFKPQGMSKIKIDQDSIKSIKDDLFGFSGSASVLFEDTASKLGSNAEVEFGGRASTITEYDRTWVTDIVLTRFHRTTVIIPKEY